MTVFNAPFARRSVLAMAGLAAPALARAQDFPSKSMRIIVPYTPGGTTDIATRLVAEPLGRVLGQPVVVENRPGANSIVGAGAAATSPADGYTLVMVLPAHAANATLQAGKLPFDVMNSFSPVSLVVTSPLIAAGTKRLPATTLREYLDHAKARPGQVNFGSSGIGATAHLAMEQLAILTGVRMTHIPYRGTQPALQDLMAGNISIMFDTLSSFKPQFEAGTIRPLAVASAQRSPFVPEMPTVGEAAGIAPFAASTWCMLLAPARTPQPIVDRVSAEVGKIVREPAMAARLRDLGFVAEGLTPAATGAFLGQEVERWGNVIRTANITVE
ncbi:tripartite tricarboxylate transporter substrate binding protein [Roseococcus sp. SYP-B2431]|uniref:Bug family tripartite tricarboxylate transporter substrate binding protein n=1 Tax=Roseococcus sp. SYP-B2431 TaxID=2496640 RepID=UPI00103C15B4|nr:tripartite tricarboxylate transporter substrate binding protein [Roseococcus sp. SYP-B2431]TCH98980.1 tripartite tricarboxylate transporter substrate binding protein [Roseococcus sp. SYP-B2431]